MKSDLAQSEDSFMAFLLGSWSTTGKDIALDANASWIGGQIGLTTEQTTVVIQSLVAKGLLHTRNVQGEILIHPSKAALNRPRPRSGLFANAVANAFWILTKKMSLIG